MSLIIVFLGMFTVSIIGIGAMWYMGDDVIVSEWVNQLFLLAVWGSILMAAIYELLAWVGRFIKDSKSFCLCGLMHKLGKKNFSRNDDDCVKMSVC